MINNNFVSNASILLSNQVLIILFQLKDKHIDPHIISEVHTALMKDFVPLHLCLRHIDRATETDKHQTAIGNILYTDAPQQPCIVADCTYPFIQKSIDNQFQRRSYSIHKHWHLVKPMILMTTVSYFLILETEAKILIDSFPLNAIKTALL